jgi:dihydrofolate reductase
MMVAAERGMRLMTPPARCHAALALTAGALDELHIHLVPVLLGQGRRLFEDMPPGHIEPDTIRVFGGPGVQHLRYRVRQAG